MADQFSNEGSSTSHISRESSDSLVELNIKTLDSQIYSFQVDKNMPVALFKEKIANEIGVPVGLQRLIFRGRVLKDDQPLSEYHVENGHTLHLVARQPAQSQTSSDTGLGETNANNVNRGNDASAGGPRSRVGQISHSVVLGTFNVADQGEGGVPDLTQVIGAVLNSFGVGNQTTSNGASGVQSSTLPNASGQHQGNETDARHSSVGGQSQAGNQTQLGQAFPSQPFQLRPQIVQIPLAAAAVPVPSLQAPIPHSLNTLSEFMTRMEQALSENGYQPNGSSTSGGDLPRVELPSSPWALPTPETLGVALRHAEQLLSGHAITALSHIAGRLERESSSSDPSVRGQIQTESVQVGIAMQHLGALLLELGRTILTLRMGNSPAESSVNTGPAVYISPSGPNPIMVQPFPLQTNSLFSGSVPPNSMSFGPVGIGNAPRHINIHIHAGTSLAPVVSAVGTRASNSEGTQGDHGNVTSLVGSGPMRVLPVTNVMAATVPSHPSGVATSDAAQPSLGVSFSQPPPDSLSLTSVLAEVHSRLRNFVGNMQGDSQVASGSVGSSIGNDVGNNQPNGVAGDGAGERNVSMPMLAPESEGPESHLEDIKASNKEDEVSVPKDAPTSFERGSFVHSRSENPSEGDPSSSEKRDVPEGAKAVPLGLGLGSLERKRRSRQPTSMVKSGDSAATSGPLDQNLNAGTGSQNLLQSLASHALNRIGANDTPSGQLSQTVGDTTERRPSGGHAPDAQFDAASAMSQVLDSPALNGLLAGVSQQTGVGSPNVLRNMMQQLVQSPQIMSTVNQIAQQVDSQDLESMFSGLGGGQGGQGGLDLSRMVQQMLPIVSQAFSRGPNTPQPFPVEPESQPINNERSSGGAEKPNDQNVQIDLQQVAQRIEHSDPPTDVFRAVVESAVQSYGNRSRSGDLVNELCSNESLATDYIEMLRHDLNQRLQGDSEEAGKDKC